MNKMHAFVDIFVESQLMDEVIEHAFAEPFTIHAPAKQSKSSPKKKKKF